MKILVCGYGFVGKAHALSLEGSLSGITTCVYDPALGYNTFPEEMDAAIIAVSTPIGYNGQCYMDNVYKCLEMIPEGIPILIKSTISLEGWRLIQRVYPKNNISFSPEYLRAAHALEDFKSQTRIQIGGGDVVFWTDVIGESIKNITWSVANPEELILTKYARNSFLALKVSFFNQMYDLCEKTGVDYNTVSYLSGLDHRIGDSHTKITKERGFGGHCFPKDTAALVATAKEYECELSILEEAIKYNERIKRG